MQRASTQMIFTLVIAVLLCSGASRVPQAQAAGATVTVKNETGFDLELLKYVKEDGSGKKVVGQTPLRNGGSHTFNLASGGSYRAYASLKMDGKLTYAKGNAYTIKDGMVAEVSLLKVTPSQKGSSMSFINQNEFDSLK